MSGADDQFKQLLKSENDYDDLIGIFASHFSGEDDVSTQKLSRRVFRSVNTVFSGKKNATRFYLSARLIKDLMLLDQNKFEEYCITEILPAYKTILSQLAHSTIEQKIPEYFGEAKEKDKLMAEKFFKIVLESIQFWSKQETNNIIFEQTYLELKQKQVPFPAQFQFYSQNDIEMQSLNISKKSQSSNQKGFQQDELKENSYRGSQKQIQPNPLYQSVEKYEDFKKQIKQAVDSCRGSEKELKNLLNQFGHLTKQQQKILEEDISKCLNVQEADPNLQNIMDGLFDQSTWFNQFEQDIESVKQGIFDTKVFFQKYGSGISHINQDSGQKLTGSHKDGTPTPQDNQIKSSQTNNQQNKQNQQTIMDFKEDDREEEEYLQQLVQQEQQQQKQKQLDSQIKVQQSQNMQSQSQIKQPSMKLSDNNQQKQESFTEFKVQIEQKQQREEVYKQNSNFDQQQAKPKGVKDYFEEELYDPHRVEEQNNNRPLAAPKSLSITQNTTAFQNSAASNNKLQGETVLHQHQNQFYTEPDRDLSADQQIKSQIQDRSRFGNQSQYEEPNFKSFTNESFRNKQYQSMIKSNSQSKFSKVINENSEKYIQPYASSKFGFNSSISNGNRYEQQKSQINDKKKPIYSEKDKLKEIKQENSNLQQQVHELQSNLKMFSTTDANQLLVELKNQSDENQRRVDQQNEIIMQLQRSLQQISNENQRLKTQGSQLYSTGNNSETEYLKNQIKKLQCDYEELLQQRSSNRSYDSKFDTIQQNTQHKPPLRKNEDFNSKNNQQGISNQASIVNNLINPYSTLQNSSLGAQSSKVKLDHFQPGQLNQSAHKRDKSPKIFEEFKPRGVNEQMLRQSVDSLNIYSNSNQNNKQFFSSSMNQQFATQNSQNGSHQLANPHNDQLNQYRSTTRVGGNVFPTINQSGQNNFKSQHKPIFTSSQHQNNTIKKTFESPQSINIHSKQGDILSQINGNDSQLNKPGNTKREFNTPPQNVPGQRLNSNGQNVNTSPKKIFDGMGDMKDVSQIPSIIFNDKREEIESIQRNNLSNNSYSESVKEILNPLSTKNNLAQDQLNSAKNTHNGKPLNFSEVKEGEEVQFDKNLFGLITQYVSKLNRFKASCLKAKYPIYEDSSVQIGVVCSHQQSNIQNQKIIKEKLEITLEYSCFILTKEQDLQKIQKLLSLMIKKVNISPEIVQEIEPKQQKKQEIIIAYSFMPFNPCFVSINYSGVSPLYLGLPNTVNKMFQFKDINKELFKRQFKERKYIKYILIPDCNQKFAKTHSDFKSHFDKLIDLNPESEFDHIQGKSKFKMGLQFSLDQFSNERNQQDYLMKIVCNPDQSAHIFIAFNDYNQNEKVHFILNTLCFLFQSNKDN